MVCADEAVVRILQIWLQRNYGFLANVFHLLLKHTDILALSNQLLEDSGVQLLRTLVIILKLFARGNELLRVLVQTEVCQVHV